MADIFAGSWTLVTGASSGLGEQFARQLGARHSNLIITARSKDKLDALAKELSSRHGIRVEVITADLGAPGGASGLCRKVDALGVEVDHLINNAGYGTLGAFLENNAESEAQMVRLNCESLTVLSRHFLEKMATRKRGGVIHVGSIAGVMPAPYMATYSATKAFVNSFSLALSEEMRPYGIRVTLLSPGYVPTGFQGAANHPSISRTDPVAILKPEEVVRQAISAYEKRKDSCMPGLGNRIGAMAMRLVPPTLTARIAGQTNRWNLRNTR